MTLLRLTCAALAATTAAIVPPAAAQEEEQHSTLTVGLGAAYVPTYEGSDDYRVVPIPQLRGKVHDFAFWTRGSGIYLDLIPNTGGTDIDLEAGPVVYARFDRNGGIKDPVVRALGKRDIAVEVGGFVGIRKTGVITSDFDNLSARVAWTKDVAGAHGSYVITPAIEYSTPLSRTAMVGIGISADYVGKGYGRYYFDVDADGSAASGLPVYTGAGDDSGFKKVSFALSGAKSLSGNLRKGWALFAVASYQKMLGDYKRAPVVAIRGDSNQWIGAVGIGYTF